MIISQVLKNVSAAYIPGCAAYYHKQDPDPWQQAHDTFEKHIGLGDSDILDSAAKTFETRCLDLLSRYEAAGEAHRSPLTVEDAFHLGYPRIRRAQSLKYKECVFCGEKKDLAVESNPKNPRDVWLICREKCA